MRVNFVFRFVNDILTKWNSIAPCWPAFESQKGFFWNRNWTLWLTRLGRGDEYSVIRMMWVFFLFPTKKKDFWVCRTFDLQTGRLADRQTSVINWKKVGFLSFFLLSYFDFEKSIFFRWNLIDRLAD